MNLDTFSWAAIEAGATAIAALTGTLALIVTVGAFAAEQRARREERTYGQARLVAGWIEATGRDNRGVLSNESDSAVTNVIVWLVAIQGAAWGSGEEAAKGLSIDDAEDVRATLLPETLAILPPGRWAVAKQVDVPGGMFLRWGLEVAFTDSAGRHWIRRAAGSLEAIKQDPATHYGVGQPQDWQAPKVLD